MQTSSPASDAVWFTMTDANALNVQGEASSANAAFARLIHPSRTAIGTLLIESVGSATMLSSEGENA